MTTATSTDYATADFYLACFLKASGLRLQDAQREGRRTVFVFENEPRRAQLVSDFYNDGVVRVSAFTHAVQDLKAVIYNW